MIGGVLVAVAMVQDRFTWSVLAMGVVICIVGISDASDVTSQSVLGVHPSVGWGLILVLAGSAVIAVWAALDLRAKHTGRRPGSDESTPAV